MNLNDIYLIKIKYNLFKDKFEFKFVKIFIYFLLIIFLNKNC